MPEAEWERGARGRRQRGATIVEYALALTLLVIGVFAGAKFLERSAAREVNNQADCVSMRPPPPPVTDASGEVVSGCQVRAVTTSTSITSAPTTAPAPPPPPTPADAGFAGTTTSGSFTTSWSATTTVSVTGGGTPVEDADVVLRIRLNDTAGNPTGSTFFGSCTTGGSGTCDVTFDVPTPGTPSITVEIDRVTFPPDTFEPGTTAGPTTIQAPP